MTLGRILVTVLLLAGAPGCSNDAATLKDPEIPVVARPKSPSTNASSPAGGLTVLKTGPFEKKLDRLRFSVPAGWREVELSAAQQGFIDARFQIPTRDGDVSLTFSSNSGGISSNIERWVGQFRMPSDQKPTIEPLDVAGKSATWVDLRGEFAAGPMGGAGSAGAPVERMLGVAIPLGDRDFYLKLTGTSAAVADVRDAFREFVRTARIGT